QSISSKRHVKKSTQSHQCLACQSSFNRELSRQNRPKHESYRTKHTIQHSYSRSTQTQSAFYSFGLEEKWNNLYSLTFSKTIKNNKKYAKPDIFLLKEGYYHILKCRHPLF